MGEQGLAVVTVAAAVAAAWAGAGFGWFLPLLWAVMLVACFALAPDQRRFFDPLWLLPGTAVLGLSWLVAADHELALRHSLLFVAAALLFGMSRRAAPDDRLLGWLAVGVALVSTVGLAQALGGLERARPMVSELPSAWQAFALTRLASGRVFGTAALPGHFAILLVLPTPLLAERVWRAAGWRRVAWGSALALAATGVALSRSLAAVGVAGALLLPFLLRGRSRRFALGGALVLAVVAATAVVLRPDLADLEPVRLRLVNWRTAAWVFAHHPWLGVGLGGVGQAGLLAPTAAANITPYAHCTPLQLLAELGVAGVATLAALGWALVRLLRLGATAAPALAAAVASVPLHNLVDFSAYRPEVLLPWAVLAGALAARVRPRPARRCPAPALLVLLAGGALLATLESRAEAVAGGTARRPADAVATQLDAARWAPWLVTPVELAAAAALRSGSPAELAQVDAELAARSWVQPRSARWAETRARLQLAQGRRGEALAWAREARRRAPWRDDLRGLESGCGAGR